MPAAVAAVLAGLALISAPLPRLPAPTYTVSGSLTAFGAAGDRVAVATGCTVRVANLTRGTAPLRVKPIGGDCKSDPFDTWVTDLQVGRTSLAATTDIAPSPHGEGFTLWAGPLLGPLHALGDGWAWTDSDVPSGSGCAWSVASGGGAVAMTKVPNRLGMENGNDTEP